MHLESSKSHFNNNINVALNGTVISEVKEVGKSSRGM